jgi:4-nitrophenyl phosphatase
MDGVLWEGESPLPGMTAFFDFLRNNKTPLYLATNNSSLTVDSYRKKLDRLGVTVVNAEIITSAMATARYLEKIARPKQRAYVIGEEGIRQALKEAGILIADPDDLHADYVVVGMDRTLTWSKLANATINLRNGAKFIGTNPDVTFPTERGIAHGNGAILAALAAASGVPPTVIGKPFPILFEMVIERAGIPKTNIVVLGDRLETDILGAKNTGLDSILVLTGVTSNSDLGKSEIQPTWVFEDLPSLQKAWKSSLSLTRQ